MSAYYSVYRQLCGEDAPLVYVASVPAESAEEAIERAKRLGITHPVVSEKDRERDDV